MEEKTALVTGASRGIGRACAIKLAKDGFNVAICSSKSETELAKTKKIIEEIGRKCTTYTCDVANNAYVSIMINDVLKRYRHIDVLVNNAGISHIGLLQDMSIDEWNNVISTNLTSLFNTCSKTIPDMVSRKSGHIINISSMWGVCGASCEVAYSASKGGVNAFTKALAKELAPSGISVNAIACGVVDTDMNACFSREEKAALSEEIPAGRFADADEIADFVVSLVHTSPYMTGQIITYDGGMI